MEVSGTYNNAIYDCWKNYTIAYSIPLIVVFKVKICILN